MSRDPEKKEQISPLQAAEDRDLKVAITFGGSRGSENISLA
jgi:hypothetical protein